MSRSGTVCLSAGINSLSILKGCVSLCIENLFLNLGEREEIINAIGDEKANTSKLGNTSI